MADELPFQFSVGPKNTELELALEEYRRVFGDGAGCELLSRATNVDDAYGKKGFSNEEKECRLAETVVWARRESEIDETDLERLSGVVATVSESSFENGYALAAILHAAAIGYTDISARIRTALICGEAAVHFDRLDGCTTAYLDAVVSLRLMARFFNLDGLFKVDTDALADNEVAIVRAWKRAVPEESSDSLLDVSGPEPAAELLEDVVWNTDFGRGNSGLIAQSDAFARLVIRLEHWVELQEGDPQALASAWERLIGEELSIPGVDSEEGALARARCASTCGDALLETGNATAAITLYNHALRHLDRSDQGPHGFHVRINRAFSLYVLGRSAEARQVFLEIDRDALQELAGIVLTVEAEWARYLAVAQLLDLSPVDHSATDLQSMVEHVSGMLVGSAHGRTGYLRNLFIGQLTRDTAAIRAMGG